VIPSSTIHNLIDAGITNRFSNSCGISTEASTMCLTRSYS
jgi:hypothetical protein